MNANFGLIDDPPAIRDRQRKRELMADRALDAMRQWREDVGVGAVEIPTAGVGVGEELS
jgi:hypothetical protein